MQIIQQSDEDSEGKGEINFQFRRESLEFFENEPPSTPKRGHGYCTLQKKWSLPYPPAKINDILVKIHDISTSMSSQGI